MILADKKIGETPLELIKRVHKKQTPITYAGRLDPMASGLIILLIDDQIKDKQKYLNLDKQYQLDILLGISTDTYDTLGKITQIDLKKVSQESIKSVINNYPNKYSQSYPPYSSKAVNGKPLWCWTRNNQLDKIKIPTKEIKIHSIKLNSISEKTLSSLTKQITTNIEKVTGNFRQTKIINQWEKLTKDYPDTKLQILNLTISCSSGTYMRSVANKIGESLKIPALALHIKRTKIGKYALLNCGLYISKFERILRIIG